MNDDYSGQERRANDADLRALRMEMAQVRASMDAATADLVTQESLNGAAKRASVRLSASYIIAAAAIVFVGLFLNSNQGRIEGIARDARLAAEQARTAATTLQDCLLVGGTCYGDLASRGTQGSVRQMRFQACVLVIDPVDRTIDKVVACAKKAYPEIENLETQLRVDGR